MTNEECKSIKELFEVKFNEFEKRIDRMLESQNGKNKMMDDRITRDGEDKQRQLDNHCEDLKSVKKTQGEIKTKLAITTTKLALVISGIIFAVVFAFDRTAAWLDNILTR